MNPDIARQAIQDYQALRRPDADPGLEAVRLAILLEDLSTVTLTDAEIDPAVLAGASAALALLARREGSA